MLKFNFLQDCFLYIIRITLNNDGEAHVVHSSRGLVPILTCLLCQILYT